MKDKTKHKHKRMHKSSDAGSDSENKSMSSHGPMRERNERNKKMDNMSRGWIYTSIFLTVLFLILIFAKDSVCSYQDESTGMKATAQATAEMQDEFIYLYSDACKEPCTETEPVAKELAEDADMVFRKIKYPQPIEVPGFFLLREEGGSTAPAVIQNKEALIVQMCSLTEDAEVCKEAEAAQADLQQAAQEAQQQAAKQQEEALASVPKKAVPEVELFVMSHCPYGTQVEKGIIPVVDLLGDKIDFEVKYVNYAMHGKTELDEQTRQYCIEEEQDDKFMPYLKCFLKEGKSEECLAEAGIDEEKLDACVEATDTEYKITEMFNDKSTWLNGRFPVFPIHATENEKYGVRGSPHVVVNEKTQSSGRDAASLLSVVCAGFEEAPAECEESLSSTPPSPGFGFEDSGSATEATCG